MAYLSLYRKHRPSTFAEVVGQDHVTRTLVHAIEEDRLHHAYLFTGQRGTGKTSTARILAAAVNCERGPTPTPCGTCDQCVATQSGTNVDVVELDMASHGGVDDARGLRDDVARTPVAARRTVYILDEVHMATNAAFNALLKVVEEPPPHVLFAMATTDPQKVLPTILSRVQRLDLRRVSSADLTAHLGRLGDVEGFTLAADAAAAVVAAGDGSVRDTLSVLEQVLAYADEGDGEAGAVHVTATHVERVLGSTPLELVLAVVDAIADADVAAALGGVQQLLEGGHDLRRFTLDLARHLRDLLVLRAAPDVPDLVDTTADRRARLAAQAERFGVDSLLRAVQLVGDVLVEQRQGPPRLPLELAVARLATPGADGDVGALADRVARLEASAGGRPGAAVAAPAARPVAPAAAAPSPSPAPAPVAAAASSPEPTPVADEVGPDAVAAPDGVTDADEPASEPAEPSATERADPTPAPASAEPEPTPTAESEPEPTPTSEPTSERTPEPADASGTEPEPEPGPAPEPAAPAGDELAQIEQSWEAILEAVADGSRRAKAFYEPGTPAALRDGVLVLRYSSDKRFHAEQARTGEMVGHLAQAIERSTGIARLRIDVVFDGEAARRPKPPPMEPAAEAAAVPSARDAVAVAEAESRPSAAPADPAALDELVREHLGGEPADEDG